MATRQSTDPKVHGVVDITIKNGDFSSGDPKKVYVVSLRPLAPLSWVKFFRAVLHAFCPALQVAYSNAVIKYASLILHIPGVRIPLVSVVDLLPHANVGKE